MSSLSIQPPFPIFTGIDGQPLENGYVWIGVANLDPEGNPIAVYWDEALTIPAPQPIRTVSGYPARAGSPARLYVDSDYSIRVLDKNGTLVYGAPKSTELLSSEFVTFVQAGLGAITTTVQTKLRESVSVKDFGAVGDGVADDTAAIQATFAFIQSQGGGGILFPTGTYNIACPIGGVLVSLSNLEGVAIYSPGAIIRDTTTYSKTPSVQTSTFLNFTDCLGVYVGPNITIQSTVVYDGVSGGSNSEGLSALYFNKGCRNIDVNAAFENLGRGAVQIASAAGSSGTDRVKGIRVRARVTNTRYGYVAAFNGDDADIEIESFNVGRVFFIYGVENYSIRVNGKNSRTSLIKSYGVGTVGSGSEVGYGCSNIEVWYTEKGGTIYQPAAGLIAVEWGDGRPATHRNIILHMDTEEPVSNPWGNTISFAKFGPGDITPDNIGRGHVLDGFEITGRMTKTTESHFAMTVGTFAAPDVMRGIHIHDLVLLGGRSMSIPGPTVADITYVSKVTSDHGVYSSSPIKTVYTACTARFFTSATNNTDIHDYLSCQINLGELQNYTNNKSFLNTVTPLGVLNSNTSNIDSYGWSSKAANRIVGDLTTTVNIFRLPASTQGSIRLKYILTRTPGDLDPATRREVFGIKQFSFSINSLGVGNIYLSITDEFGPRTFGASPAVLTLSLVNGDATNGAFIAMSATNYNQTDSRAILEAELLGVSGYPSRIYPV
jgi:hypothetical protein